MNSHILSERYLGQHLLVDYYNCDAIYHSSKDFETLFVKAIKNCGGTIVQSIFHQFSPYGISGVIVIAESHVTLHTWPENKIACIDVFSCSPSLILERMVDEIAEILQAEHYKKSFHHRGDLLLEKSFCN